MIHDVLLSCLNLHSASLPLESILASGAVSEFFHPCEKKILEDIIVIINSLRDVAKFAKIYGSNQNVSTKSAIHDADDPLPNGLYLKAFANGIDKVLEEYLDEITELERSYLQNPTHTLLHIYLKLQIYEPLAWFLRKLIRGIRLQKLHGCAILSHVHKNVAHGDRRIHRAMQIILASINVVFFKHLSHWILYAKIVDQYGEFFVQCAADNSHDSTVGSDKVTSTGGGGGGRQTLTTLSDAGSSTYGEIWRYDICYEMLPYFLSSSWAEKVLFIGQTVLIFKADAGKTKKRHASNWNRLEKNVIEIENSLWNGTEHIYFGKIQALQHNEHILHHYERVIDEIKLYVTTRLSEIAINQADLVQQLKHIKDYYLLGRGEIFLDFIRLTSTIEHDKDKDFKLREFVKAFETAAQNIGVTEILDQITLSIPKPYMYAAAGDESQEVDYMQKVQLDYCINWPLHLLFSPKVMERYNLIFRFLLLIKKTQYDLNMVWFGQSKSKQRQFNMKLMHLRNQLMFFVNTLQYYIQVDVLESQFSILLNTINNKADFEQIQKAHSIFQANILSLCFLLCEESQSNSTTMQTSTLGSSHPVCLVFNEILSLCEDFYTIMNSNKNCESLNIDADKLCERFSKLIEQLLSMLVSLKAVPGTTALSQLLLRLDFNRWFSLECKTAHGDDGVVIA